MGWWGFEIMFVEWNLTMIDDDEVCRDPVDVDMCFAETRLSF